MQVFITIFAVVLGSTFVLAQDFVCEDGTMMLSPSIMEGIQKCGEEFNGKPNFNCKYFCNAEVFGLLDSETGLPSQETYDDWVDEEFHEKDREYAKQYFSECFQNAGVIELPEEDETCTSARKFNDCTWALKPQTC